MRNRAGVSKERENDFINGGTAALTTTGAPQPKAPDPEPVKKAKAKPVSISFTDENLKDIDNRIRNEILAGGSRVNRSDIVRAAILGLEHLSDEEISVLISKAKLQ
ncbi:MULTISPECIES: hypothetical protein [Pantoea]|uniref:Uncharacterized protein n=1 Tax=Pantoea cypripedii TaxID=55209 RepID=A0A1X1ELF7_PANCY|nr:MULTISPECIES: hypothetical protein [Pantoea]MBP2200113.1 hypothetical protein [Pantoea cypripedii]MDE1188312.1 hypothetical protein [Pantoea sp.]ORM89716.1 hypothetical protein HA50_24245 [Pantoea cypripedii]